ncbi:MAG: hypothetical protein FWF22_08190 [Treponema sp.]|nr:hypothetical protein [Treponema sp.]
MKKFVLILALAVLVGGAAFSLDLTTFPSPLKPGALTVNVGATLGSYWWYGTAFGAMAQVDYCLPLPIALTAGGEAGVMFTGGGYYSYSGSLAVIPIMARVAWHPNFEIPNLDTYVALKLGYGLGFWTSKASGYADYTNPGGFIFGGVIGARYFFSSNIAAYAELGWENYTLNYTYSSYNYSTYEYISRFLTAGVTFAL